MTFEVREGEWAEVQGGRRQEPPATDEVVCFDLDSTLCDTRHRHHLVLPGEERDQTDWVAYSLACAGDAPIDGTCRLLRLLARHWRIVLVSSRDEQARSLTEQWLVDHGIPYDELILGGTDGAPAGLEEFKVHHVRTLLSSGLRVVLMVDDLPTLPPVMAEIGVPTLSVRPPQSL
jgi:hypothetical protein